MERVEDRFHEEHSHELEAEIKFSELNVVMMGLPGSGKSTLVNSLTVRPNYISLGDITRAEVAEGTPLGKDIEKRFKSSAPWDADFVVGIVKPKIIEAMEAGRGYVLDGVPRGKEEAEELFRLHAYTRQPIDMALFLDIDPEEAMTRVLQRAGQEQRREKVSHYTTRVQRYLADMEAMERALSPVTTHVVRIDTTEPSEEDVKRLLLDQVKAIYL